MTTESIFYVVVLLVVFCLFVWVANALFDRLGGDELDGEQP